MTGTVRLAVSSVKRRFFSFRAARSDLAGMRAVAQSRVVGCGFTGPKPMIAKLWNDLEVLARIAGPGADSLALNATAP